MQSVRRQDGAGVQEPVRVERALDGAHRGELAGAPGALEPVRLGDADAVFGADRAAAVEGESQDGVVVGSATEKVDVHVPVAEMPEQDRARLAGRARDLLEEAREPVQWYADVELVRHAGGVDGLGVAFAQAPQAL